ncbi:MAG: 2-C-methyl-D-erythritol 4-phosphate cytidylyltransferase [Gammaproteobacteria bacterium]|nr:2-C-methyl-D-erythritol 4-phosphate cytidylyltransferase [Gammaproteobacteria bacterium]
MSPPERCWAVVPAAGVGSRMGSAIPKQYLDLVGSMVIERTLQLLLEHPRIERVYVAVSPDDRWWEGCRFAADTRLCRVDGGAERSASVLNALDRLAGEADAGDWVLVHDAARPCLHPADIDRLIDRLQHSSIGGLLAVRLSDTIKREGAPGMVAETLPREQLWRALTPQMFRLQPLRSALLAAARSAVPVTDEASAMEFAGHAPRLIEGRADNIKITHPGDLDLAAFFLQRQRREA